MEEKGKGMDRLIDGREVERINRAMDKREGGGMGRNI